MPGFNAGDVVLAVDGADVDDMQALNYRIATHKAGDAPSFSIYSRQERARCVRDALHCRRKTRRATLTLSPGAIR